MSAAIEGVKSLGVCLEVNKRRRFLPLHFLIIFIAVSASLAQTPSVVPTPSPQPSPSVKIKPSSLERHFFYNLLKDQRGIWLSPLSLRENDMRWFVPLGIAAVALLATDRRTAGALDNSKTRINISRDVSQLGAGYTLGGAAAAFYLIGKAANNSRAKETGLLEAEALIDGAVVAQVLKFATQRPRPLSDNGSGRFFRGGNSFPSGHAVSAWSFAAIIADEYGKHRPLLRFGIYGLATEISLSRYTGRNHFLGDILVGSSIGYGIGHYVYLRHHDTDLDSPNGGVKKTTRLEKYFPLIIPQYDARRRIYGASLAWNF
ncbi:MAG: phosphatase PAP2 family protein [Pyrinomonadaceae bacterium]